MRRIRHHRRGPRPRVQWIRGLHTAAIAQADLPGNKSNVSWLATYLTATHAGTIERIHLQAQVNAELASSDIDNTTQLWSVQGIVMNVPQPTLTAAQGKDNVNLDWLPDPWDTQRTLTEPQETDDYPLFCFLEQMPSYTSSSGVIERFNAGPDCGTKSKRRLELGQSLVLLVTVAANVNVDDLVKAGGYLRYGIGYSMLYRLN